MELYDITVRDMEDNEVSLSEYRGKVLLIVNTATGCGYTPQYNGLQELYAKYRDRGFEILDFPCNQFAGQAPGTIEEIHEFCTIRYKITFRQFAKISVNGPGASPLYTWLKKQKSGALGSRIKWNFTKFLIGRTGVVAGRYGSAETPDQIEPDIAALL